MAPLKTFNLTSHRFTLPDGTIAEVRFLADENGYQPESPLIPTPHPLPAHALEQIRIGQEQNAQGITFDNQGFRVDGGRLIFPEESEE